MRRKLLKNLYGKSAVKLEEKWYLNDEEFSESDLASHDYVENRLLLKNFLNLHTWRAEICLSLLLKWEVCPFLTSEKASCESQLLCCAFPNRESLVIIKKCHCPPNTNESGWESFQVASRRIFHKSDLYLSIWSFELTSGPLSSMLAGKQPSIKIDALCPWLKLGRLVQWRCYCRANSADPLKPKRWLR